MQADGLWRTCGRAFGPAQQIRVLSHRRMTYTDTGKKDTRSGFGAGLLELGRRKAVGGQEDMIIDVALELARKHAEQEGASA